MSRSPPPGLAKFNSASVMLIALARFLHGKDFPATGQPRLMQYPASLADWLPRQLRQWLFTTLGAAEGVAPGKIGEIDATAISDWLAGLYPRRRYPAVMIGSSSGALVHIGAALGIPWLPQTFLTLVRQKGVQPDDARGAMLAQLETARRFLAANPDVQLHHMQDPNQDRLMLSKIAYFRSKFRRLPAAYRALLTECLAPGGTIIVTECTRRWPVTRAGERHVYQFGALGGATPEEYLHGSARVSAYLARSHSAYSHWDPPPPDEDAPEAEWGFAPALRDDIVSFAAQHGYRVIRLLFDDPEHLSPAVAELYRLWYRARDIPAERLLIESFILLEPYWTFRTGSVPFWMTFNTQPSLDWVRRYFATAEPFDHIQLMLFAHGIESVGLPPIEAWEALLENARCGGSLLGIDRKAYPAHFSTFGRYYRDLRKLPAPFPIPAPMPLQQFEDFMTSAGGSSPVRLEL